MINFVVCGLYVPLLFPGVPAWAVILVQIALVSFVNARGVQVTAIVNNILVIFQAVFLFAFIFFCIKLITGGTGSLLDPSGFFNVIEFNKPNMGSSVILGGASVLALSFLGFDSVTTLSEETINPGKTIGRALIIICLAAGGVFVIAAYLFQLAWPNGWAEMQNPDTGAFELIGYVAGSFMCTLFIVVSIVGTTASAIASQASAARILFGMGRDGAIPKKFFGHINSKTKVPTYNIYLISVIGLAALVLNLQLATSLINFGALLGFALVNVSVILHYFVKKKERGGKAVLNYLILPIAGAIVCLAIWANLDSRSLTLGGCWLEVGFIYLAITTNFFRKLPPELNMTE
jgi:putrescine importer